MPAASCSPPTRWARARACWRRPLPIRKSASSSAASSTRSKRSSTCARRWRQSLSRPARSCGTQPTASMRFPISRAASPHIPRRICPRSAPSSGAPRPRSMAAWASPTCSACTIGSSASASTGSFWEALNACARTRRARRAGSATSGSRRELVDRALIGLAARSRRAEHPAIAVDEHLTARRSAVGTSRQTAEIVEHGERGSAQAIENAAAIGGVRRISAARRHADEVAIAQDSDRPRIAAVGAVRLAAECIQRREDTGLRRKIENGPARLLDAARLVRTECRAADEIARVVLRQGGGRPAVRATVQVAEIVEDIVLPAATVTGTREPEHGPRSVLTALTRRPVQYALRVDDHARGGPAVRQAIAPVVTETEKRLYLPPAPP